MRPSPLKVEKVGFSGGGGRAGGKDIPCHDVVKTTACITPRIFASKWLETGIPHHIYCEASDVTSNCGDAQHLEAFKVSTFFDQGPSAKVLGYQQPGRKWFQSTCKVKINVRHK
jgi:hypothetical protein